MLFPDIQKKPIYPAHVIPDHPVAQTLIGAWLFNEGGGSIAFDSSGYGNHGDLASAPGWVEDPKYGGGLEFYLTNEYVNIPFNPALAFSGTDPIAIVTRFKSDPTAGTYAGTLRQANEIRLHHNKAIEAILFVLDSFSSNDRVESGAGSAPEDVWLQAAGTFDGTTMKVYVDGVEQNSVVPTGTYGGSTYEFRISHTVSDFDGVISYVYLFRGLIEEHVKWLYEDPFCMFESYRPIFYDIPAAAPAFIPKVMMVS